MKRWLVVGGFWAAVSLAPSLAVAQDSTPAGDAARKAIDAELPTSELEKVGGDQTEQAIKQGGLPVASAQSVDKLTPADAAARAKKDPKAFEASATAAAARQLEEQGEAAAKAIGTSTSEKELTPIAGRANIKRALAAGPISDTKAAESLGGLSAKDATDLAKADPERFKAGAASTAQNAARDEGARAEQRIDQESPHAEVTSLAGGPAQLAKVPPPSAEALPGGQDPAKTEAAGRAEGAADHAVAQAERALDAETAPMQLNGITGGLDTRQLAREVNEVPSSDSPLDNAKAVKAAKAGVTATTTTTGAAPDNEQAADNAEQKLDAAAETARRATET